MTSKSGVACFWVCSMVCFFLAADGFAQEKRVEIIPYVGYTASGGIDVQSQDVGNGVIVNRIGPKSGLSYGFVAGFFVTENVELGFNFSQQESKLESKGSEKIEWTDMNVRNYHGILTYNFDDEDSALRPFLFGGMGATQYAPGDIEGQSVGSSTRFSMTWGGGLKAYAGDNIGFRFTGRWTPTYIQSTASGVWCSPWWPWSCWVVGNAHYSNQFEMSGGVILTF